MTAVRFRLGLVTRVTAGLAFLSAATLALASAPPEEAVDDAPRDETGLAEPVEASPLVAQLLTDPTLTDQARQRLRIEHGRWDALGPVDALDAVSRGRLSRIAAMPDAMPDAAAPLDRAWAAIAAGRAADGWRILETLDEPDSNSIEAERLRVRALRLAGRPEEAERIRDRAVTAFMAVQTDAEPAARVHAAMLLADPGAMTTRSPAAYRQAMAWLGEAMQRDPLHWRAALAEATLLAAKGNRSAAASAVQQALRLNPQAAEARYQLARLALGGYDFELTRQIIDSLHDSTDRGLHPLGLELEARMLLQQRLPDEARPRVLAGLERWPRHRELLALRAAVEAVDLQSEAYQAALAAYRGAIAEDHAVLARGDDDSPAISPRPEFEAGRYLAMMRQYAAGADVLRGVLDRQPRWAEAHVELGMLLVQAGLDEQAEPHLARAVELDPFHHLASNQLRLVRELDAFQTLETDHFLVRWRAPIDAVVAHDLVRRLEPMRQRLARRYNAAPTRRTVIEIAPDQQWFSVRVTGLPEVWTIAASTGDVIALTPPRHGPRLQGPYPWFRVVRHEFIHTLTLDMTGARIPHWLTEALAVDEEAPRRDHATRRLLAESFFDDRLFPIAELNWPFVRPRREGDRAIAYAQAHWVLDFLVESHGWDRVLALLDRFDAGDSQAEAIQRVYRKDEAELDRTFRIWAGEQLAAWGMGDSEALDRVQAYRKRAEEALRTGDRGEARRWIDRMLAVQSDHPWALQHALADAAASGRDDTVRALLGRLTEQEPDAPRWALASARLARLEGEFDVAAAAIDEAVDREPYNPALRELAAAIALLRSDDADAERQLRALVTLEPEAALHWLRLAAFYDRRGRTAERDAAAQRAVAIDPAAPVDALPD